MSKAMALEEMSRRQSPIVLDSEELFECHMCYRLFKEKEGRWCAVGDYNHAEFMCNTDYYEMLEYNGDL